MSANDFRRSSFAPDESEDHVEVDVRGPVFITVRAASPESPELLFSKDEWREFIAGVKAGEFDLSAEDGWVL